MSTSVAEIADVDNFGQPSYIPPLELLPSRCRVCKQVTNLKICRKGGSDHFGEWMSICPSWKPKRQDDPSSFEPSTHHFRFTTVVQTGVEQKPAFAGGGPAVDAATATNGGEKRRRLTPDADVRKILKRLDQLTNLIIILAGRDMTQDGKPVALSKYVDLTQPDDADEDDVEHYHLIKIEPKEDGDKREHGPFGPDPNIVPTDILL